MEIGLGRSQRYRTLILTLALVAVSLSASVRAESEAMCGGEPFQFKLNDVKGRLFEGAASVTKAPVVLFFYQGYKSGDVLDNLREALKRDPIVGDGTRLMAR